MLLDEVCGGWAFSNRGLAAGFPRAGPSAFIRALGCGRAAPTGSRILRGALPHCTSYCTPGNEGNDGVSPRVAADTEGHGVRKTHM